MFLEDYFQLSIVHLDQQEMKEIFNNISETSQRYVERLESTVFPNHNPNNSLKELALLGAGIGIPLALGYGIRQYILQKPKLKEKIPWSQLGNGGNIISRVLANQNIRFAFSLTDSDFKTLNESCTESKIKLIHMKDYNNAIVAAGGVYRMTGQIGVVFVHAGPEMLSMISGIINSNVEHIPLVIIGVSPILNKNSFDESLLSKYFKWSKTIHSINDITNSIENSFCESIEGTPGAVYLEIGEDLLLPENIAKEILEGHQKSRWYFNKLWSDFSQQFKYPSPESDICFHYPRLRLVDSPKTKQVEEILNLLLDAKYPLLFIGDQCLVSNSIQNKELNIDSLKLSIKLLGVPTYLTGFSKCLGGLDINNLIHDNIDYAVHQADLIITCGVTSPTFLEELKVNYMKTNVVSIEEFPTPSHSFKLELIKKLSCDPSAFLLHLGFLFPKVNSNKWKNWLYDLKEKDSIGHLIEEKKSMDKGDHLNPHMMARSLKDTFKKFERAPIIVSDVGVLGENLNAALGESIHSWIQQSKFYSHGSSIGLAIAAKLCYPDNDCWMIADEKSISKSVQEFETLSRYHLPINIIVGNHENSLHLLKDEMKEKLSQPNHQPQYQLQVNQQHNNQQHSSRTAFHKVMSAFGGKGFILSHSDAKKEDIEKTFCDAREKSLASQKPILINCWVDNQKSTLIPTNATGAGSM
ncbi:hypothetical protein CYY_006291 [Polysphondylium violaceum]|uniref:2-hydroxyacyl-CoA lyase n=1 Tax=Polysphondylium violaceum TaxID=133409 RepID=A0A8J4PSE8_9MYCE|nr:hypothetical protein CYY_006291 [Polysphondylium violaceum]